MVTIKSKKEVECMKEACKVVAILYDKLEKEIKVGMSTWEVDQIAEKIIRSLGAIPAEKGYDVGIRGIPPYPASICISINDEVIHGVPSKHKIIKDGDIVSVDTVALKKGFNGDAARTFMIGNVSKELCGGPHVQHTGELGHFKIVKEEACSSGVRRIKAILEKGI